MRDFGDQLFLKNEQEPLKRMQVDESIKIP